MISGGVDFDSKRQDRLNNKEYNRNRVSRKRLCLTRLAYQVPWTGDSRTGVRWVIYALSGRVGVFSMSRTVRVSLGLAFEKLNDHLSGE